MNPRTGRSAWLTALTLVVWLWHPGTASAAASGQVIEVKRHGDTVEVVVDAVPMTPGEELTPDSVVASLDGKPVKASKVALPSNLMAPTREVVLVLDTSGSMAGDRMNAAKAAATAFVDAAPAETRVGLVTFSDVVTVRSKPTLERAAVRDAIAALVADGSTSLYDGVQAALASMGASDDRHILILSDGADTTSSSALPPVVAALRQSGAVVDAVDVGGDPAAVAALTQMTTAGDGRMVGAKDAQQLIQLFVKAASTVPSQVMLSFPLPADPEGRQVPLTFTVTTGAGAASGAASVELSQPTVTAAPPINRDTDLPPWLLWSGLASLFVAAVLALLGASSAGVSRGSRARELMAQYTTVPAMTHAPIGPDSVLMEKGPLARAAVELADKVAKRRNIETGLVLALDRAAIAWQPSEWLVLQACLALTGLALAVLLGHGLLLGLLVAAVAGWLIPKSVLHVRFRRRRKAFIAGMPDALQLVAGSLTTGYSLAQALDASVQEGAQPVSGELGRALAEARLGVPLEDALDVVAERMDSEDFRWVVMAVRVQRDVGGNLAEVLTKVCVTMRDRASLRRQVQALSAEGRISAYVLIALPIFLGFYLFLVNRDYFRPMYTELPGMLALGYTAFSLVLGAVWMNKLVKVEM